MSNLPYSAHPTAVIDDGCEIGEGTKIWHFCHIMINCKIGEGCNIGQNVVISPEVVLGKNVKVQNNVSIYTGVTCDDDVFLGPSMVFTNVINPRSAVNRKNEYLKTHVGRGATIGANATIVCGNPIGEFAFIGAGAVVTKEVKPYALIVGNPARQIGWMSEAGQKLVFDEKSEAVCSETGQKYRLENGRVNSIKPVDPSKRIQIFKSFEEQEASAIAENLKKSIAERIADAVELIRKVYPPAPENLSKRIVFVR